MVIHTLLDAHDRAALIERADRLAADTPARWGSMDAARMLRHCAEALRGSLGDVVHPSAGKRLFRTRLVRHLFIRVLPFPKNAPTAPALRMTAAADLEAERAQFRELVQRFGAPPSAGPPAEHPLFGVLSRDEWGELEYKHLDHHLRQFGV